jgi:hypothetical protein
MYKFIGHDSWRGRFDIPDTRSWFEKKNRFYGRVEILRPIPWFYVGQKDIMVTDLIKWYTDAAIFTFINDHFITIEELDKEGNVENVEIND